MSRGVAPHSVDSASALGPSRYMPRNGKGAEHVRFLPKSTISNSYGLLLTSRQMFMDTTRAVERLRASNRLVFVLDVILANDTVLWPTWLCVPATAPIIDRLEVTIRALGARPRTASRPYYFNSSGGIVSEGFNFILQHFLLVAPGKGIVVRSLVMDFSDDGVAEDVGNEAWHRWRIMHAEYEEDLPDDFVPIAPRASWAANYVNHSIAWALSMDVFTSPYAGILFERIGSIEVQTNERSLERYDLGKFLAPLAFDNPAATFQHVNPVELRLPTFWDWKENAVKARIAAGLSLCSPIEERPGHIPTLAEAQARLAHEPASVERTRRNAMQRLRRIIGLLSFGKM
ncbi:hypothetical protein EXIGLDRAFT_716457 [Exidia glandulosa HHB12029]|uniref:Uncharacterized protein n=1 Tax=Exidia glandulosa HHB12029 TaxID=1314781 RepID=A0A165P8U2_EXIGL|nr:hypothetical protein EXIGLDRAFT_716457 [Exidia glandulosa HHB12029]